MADQPSKYTAKEFEYMAAALQSLEGKIPTHGMLDKAKFTALTGLTESSARTIWNKLRKKLADGQASGGVSPASAKGEARNKNTTNTKRDLQALDGMGSNGGMAAVTSQPVHKKRKLAEAQDGEDTEAEAEAEAEDK